MALLGGSVTAVDRGSWLCDCSNYQGERPQDRPTGYLGRDRAPKKSQARSHCGQGGARAP